MGCCGSAVKDSETTSQIPEEYKQPHVAPQGLSLESHSRSQAVDAQAAQHLYLAVVFL